MRALPPLARRELAKACRLVRNAARQMEIVLFVTTPSRSPTLVRREAERARMPYAVRRWLAGTLTNYSTLRTRLRRLDEIERWEQDDTLKRYSNKERSRIAREKGRLLEDIEGLRALTWLPSVVVIVRPVANPIAVAEARKIGAAVIAVGDADRRQSFDATLSVTDETLPIVLKELADAILRERPKGPAKKECTRRPQPPDEEGPGMAPVPARLRPRPSPKRGSARPDPS